MSVAQTMLSQFKEKGRKRPDQHGWTGQSCGTLGALRCWTVKGQAQIWFEEIENDIQQLLINEANVIEECQSTQEEVGWSMYMIGKNAGEAVPTLLIDCLDNKTRAVTANIIKTSEFWKSTTEKHPALRLGSSALLPQECVLKYNHANVDDRIQQPGTLSVYSDANIGGLCGIQIFVNTSEDPLLSTFNVVTLGGVVLLDDVPFGLTVAQASKQEALPQQTQDTVDNDEFSFEDEGELETGLGFVNPSDEG